jgi:hypothetical protein
MLTKHDQFKRNLDVTGALSLTDKRIYLAEQELVVVKGFVSATRVGRYNLCFA